MPLLFAGLFGARSVFATSTQLTPISGHADVIYDGYSTDNVNVSNVFGKSTTSSWASKVGMKYIPEANRFICQIDIVVGKAGSPSDGLKVEVYNGGTTVDNGNIVATSYNTWSASEIASNNGQVLTYWFDGTSINTGACFGVVAGQTYWITVSRTGSLSDTDYYFWYHTTTGGQPTEATGLSYSKEFGQYTNSGINMHPDIDIYGISDGTSIEPNIGDWQCSVDTWFPGYETLCTFVHTILIPPNGFGAFIKGKMNDSQGLLYSKAPFAYFVQIKNQVTNLDTTTTTTGYLMDTTLHAHTATAADISIPIQAFNTAAGSSERGIFDEVRPYIETFLWLYFAWYLLTRGLRLFKGI